MADSSKPLVRKAATAAGPASAKKAKVAPQSKTPANKNPTVASDTRFAWQAAADDCNAFRRLEIKEEAVRQGFRYADRIRSDLAPIIESSAGSTGNDHSGCTELMNWVTQLDEIKKQDSDFRVFIGFAGATGAGKTSGINSIIGFRGLLPSSSQAAATAVPCLIAYNDDPNPDAAFRAQVIFRTEDDIRDELDQYFNALKIREEVNMAFRSEESDHNLPGPPGASSTSARDRQAKLVDRLKDLEIVEEHTNELLEMVSAVFGLDEEELKTESTEGLLATHPDVRMLLGQTITVVSGDGEEFSENIKPYMDSVPAVHGTSGVEFAAWPLINEVRVFVRSNVLKNGIVLVDLPGLADSVASRASVAQNYFSKLSVTAIVTPVVRALNEQTAVNLMTENRQLCLQMDGKFHKKSFCVILSKMDDINTTDYLKQQKGDAIKNEGIQQCQGSLKTLDQDFKVIEREKSQHIQLSKSIDRERSKLQAGDRTPNKGTKAPKAVEAEECNKRRLEAQAKGIAINRRLQANRKQAKYLKGRLLHWCIQVRNVFVDKKIQADFERRQKRLAIATRQPDLYDGTVKTFPISSSAYWEVVQNSEAPVGFPAAEYTGVPALKHWLRYAAIPDREKHLDTVLNALHGLYNAMHAWSSLELQGELSLTKQFVNDEVLHRPLHNFETALNKTFNKLGKQIKALDPLKNQESTLANCKQRCIDVVRRWSSKETDNVLCRTKMHWTTYNACVNRNGRVHMAKVQGIRTRYAWIESLCNIFYQGIVNDWNRTLDEEIPALREPTNKTIDDIWATLMQQLEKRVRITAPQMQSVFDTESEKLNQVKDRLKDMVRDQFKRIKMGAAKAHKTVNNSVADKWEPAFKRAKNERGKGMFERQQQLLIAQAELRGSNMFKESTGKIAGHLGDQLKSLHKNFHGITEAVRSHLRDLIMIMLKLDGLPTSGDGETAMVTWKTSGSKEKVQQDTKHLVMEWTARWRIGIDADVRTDATDTTIPEAYYETDGADDSDSEELNDDAYKEFLAREAEDGLHF